MCYSSQPNRYWVCWKMSLCIKCIWYLPLLWLFAVPHFLQEVFDNVLLPLWKCQSLYCILIRLCRADVELLQLPESTRAHITKNVVRIHHMRSGYSKYVSEVTMIKLAIKILSYLWHKNQQHAKKTTEYNGQRCKCKRCILLGCDHYCNRCGNYA